MAVFVVVNGVWLVCCGCEVIVCVVPDGMKRLFFCGCGFMDVGGPWCVCRGCGCFMVVDCAWYLFCCCERGAVIFTLFEWCLVPYLRL